MTRQAVFRVSPHVAALLAVLTPMALMALTGRVELWAVLIVLAVLAVVSYRQPLPAVLLLMLLSTSFFELVDLGNIPYLQVTPVVRLNAMDLALLMLFAYGIVRLRQRHEKPLFLHPVLFLGGAVGISLVFGLIAGTTGLSGALNGLRQVSGYLFYIALVGVLDTPRKVRTAVTMVFIIAAASVALQGVEVALGRRIITPWTGSNVYFSTTMNIHVEGMKIPYLWNRAVTYILLGLFLALGGLLEKKAMPCNAALAALAAGGFAFSLIRSWLLFVGLGIGAVLFLQRQRTSILIGLGSAGLLLIGGAYAWNSLVQSSSFPLFGVLALRLGSLLRFWEEPNFVGRVEIWRDMLAIFWRSPIWGQGVGGGLLNTDVGMANTLVTYGLLGWGSTLYLIGAFLTRGRELLRRYPPSLERGYTAGLIGMWLAACCAFATSMDFFLFANLNMAAGLAMALLDRLAAFAPAAEPAERRRAVGIESERGPA